MNSPEDSGSGADTYHIALEATLAQVSAADGQVMADHIRQCVHDAILACGRGALEKELNPFKALEHLGNTFRCMEEWLDAEKQ